MEEIKIESVQKDGISVSVFCTKKTNEIILGHFVFTYKNDFVVHTEINKNGIPVVYFLLGETIALPEYKGWNFFIIEQAARYVSKFALYKSDEPHS
jgi:hypothetical protein